MVILIRKQKVLGVAVASALYVFSLGAKVGGARKAAGVSYPYRKYIYIFVSIGKRLYIDK